MKNNMIKTILIALVASVAAFFVGWKIGDWMSKREESKKNKPLNS